MSKRMQQLVLMLSSDQDGEVVNAARAIGRELKKLQIDWHVLASRLSLEAPKPSAPVNNSFATDNDVAMVQKIFNDHAAELSAQELAFIRKFVLSCRIYGEDKVYMTIRQRGWLQVIYRRVTA